MSRIKGQRIKLLYLADIFEKYTDEEHPLSAAELIEKLADKGIPVERKAIYGDISLLCEYGMDIVRTRVPKSDIISHRAILKYPRYICLPTLFRRQISYPIKRAAS